MGNYEKLGLQIDLELLANKLSKVIKWYAVDLEVNKLIEIIKDYEFLKQKLYNQDNVTEDTPLLSIVLEDINSIPVVKYNGEEIDKKVRVTFSHNARTSESYLRPNYIQIEYVDPDAKQGNTKTIQHNRPNDEEGMV